jgi:hypothetical protein
MQTRGLILLRFFRASVRIALGQGTNPLSREGVAGAIGGVVSSTSTN